MELQTGGRSTSRRRGFKPLRLPMKQDAYKQSSFVPDEIKKRWIRLIHTAKNALGLDEEAYRAILEGAGLSSSKEIQNAEQFTNVMDAFRALGFTPKPTQKKLSIHEENQGFLCSRKQLYYILGLWELASRRKDEQSLRAMIKRVAGVDDIRFLTKQKASAVILALREIAQKAGFDPDRPKR